jgi:hypothetical protein
VCVSFISLYFHIIIVIIIDFHQEIQQTILKLTVHCFSYIFHYHIVMWIMMWLIEKNKVWDVETENILF